MQDVVCHQPDMTPARSLVGMWMLAVRAQGKPVTVGVVELNALAGRRYTYKRVWDWKAGRRNVPSHARRFMLRMALPYICKCVGVMPTKTLLNDLEVMLS